MHPPNRRFTLVLALCLITAAPAVLCNAEPRGSRGGNYLIVSASDFIGSAALNQFITHKQALGFNVTTYEATAGTSNTDIKSYIAGLWGTADAPDYVLLVGDTRLRAPNKGAAAYLSASNYIYWGSVAAWEPSGALEKAFFTAIFEDDIWEVGPDWSVGRIRRVRRASTASDVRP